MAKRNGRDWSDWKEHITGMHRLGEGNFRQPHLGSPSHETQTSLSISRHFDKKEKSDPSLRVWIIVFICALLARKCYFEFTKYSRIQSASASHSRSLAE
jgi:hypothetical protein